MSPAPRRRAPRTMAQVLNAAIDDLTPADPLAQIQRAWPQIAGARYSPVSRPTRMRPDGTVTITCDSGMVAADLQMSGPELCDLIAEQLGLTCTLRFEGPGRR